MILTDCHNNTPFQHFLHAYFNHFLIISKAATSSTLKNKVLPASLSSIEVICSGLSSGNNHFAISKIFSVSVSITPPSTTLFFKITLIFHSCISIPPQIVLLLLALALLSPLLPFQPLPPQSCQDAAQENVP